eukprot:237733-Chlamydomonas_euryale.AAC.1
MAEWSASCTGCMHDIDALSDSISVCAACEDSMAQRRRAVLCPLPNPTRSPLLPPAIPLPAPYHPSFLPPFLSA